VWWESRKAFFFLCTNKMCTVQHWLTFMNPITHIRYEDEQSVWALFFNNAQQTLSFFKVISWFMLSKQILFFCDLWIHTRKLWLHTFLMQWIIALRLPEMIAATIRIPVPQNLKNCSENIAYDELCLWGLHLSLGRERIS